MHDTRRHPQLVQHALTYTCAGVVEIFLNRFLKQVELVPELFQNQFKRIVVITYARVD